MVLPEYGSRAVHANSHAPACDSVGHHFLPRPYSVLLREGNWQHSLSPISIGKQAGQPRAFGRSMRKGAGNGMPLIWSPVRIAPSNFQVARSGEEYKLMSFEMIAALYFAPSAAPRSQPRLSNDGIAAQYLGLESKYN